MAQLHTTVIPYTEITILWPMETVNGYGSLELS